MKGENSSVGKPGEIGTALWPYSRPMGQKLNTKDLVPANGGGYPVAVWKNGGGQNVVALL